MLKSIIKDTNEVATGFNKIENVLLDLEQNNGFLDNSAHSIGLLSNATKGLSAENVILALTEKGVNAELVEGVLKEIGLTEAEIEELLIKKNLIKENGKFVISNEAVNASLGDQAKAFGALSKGSLTSLGARLKIRIV